MSLKVKGCRIFPAWFGRQSEETKAMLRAYVQDPKYSHLYPCPKANGGWGYKSECHKCGNAIKVEEEE